MTGKDMWAIDRLRVEVAGMKYHESPSADGLRWKIESAIKDDPRALPLLLDIVTDIYVEETGNVAAVAAKEDVENFDAPSKEVLQEVISRIEGMGEESRKGADRAGEQGLDALADQYAEKERTYAFLSGILDHLVRSL